MSTYREALEQLEAMKLEKRSDESVSLSPRDPASGDRRRRPEGDLSERMKWVGVRAYPIDQRPRLQLYALPTPEAAS
jgi:hypothetical protein